MTMPRHTDRGPQHCAYHSAGVHCDAGCPGRLLPESAQPADAPHTYYPPLAAPETPHYLAHESTMAFNTGLPGNVPVLGAVRYAGMELAAVRSPDELSENRTTLEVDPESGPPTGDEGEPGLGPETVEEMDEATEAAEVNAELERAERRRAER